jgi:hypothetical protein
MRRALTDSVPRLRRAKYSAESSQLRNEAKCNVPLYFGWVVSKMRPIVPFVGRHRELFDCDLRSFTCRPSRTGIRG